MEQYKTCTKCGQTKLNSQFSKSKLGKYGTRSQCKPCNAAKTAEYRSRHPDYAAKSARKYRLENPDKVAKAAEDWRKRNPDYGKKYHAQHRDTERLRSRNYYNSNRAKESARKRKARLRNPEVFQKRSREYASTHRTQLNAKAARRRALKANAKTYTITTKEINRLYNAECFYCENSSTTIDHVMPLNRGGSHGIGNLVPCCGSCNFSKRDLTIMEWRIWRLRLGL